MKSKTLMTIAVASTIGWAAGAFAGSSHEVQTPLSVNDTGEVIVAQHNGGFGSSDRMASAPSYSHHAAGMTGTYTNDASAISSGDEFASLNMDETLALDEGVYSDFYLVGWTPSASDDWMSYTAAIEAGHQFAAIDDVVFVPAYDIALITDDALIPSQEEMVALIQSEMPLDSAEVG
jgi:hypothetical protein